MENKTGEIVLFIDSSNVASDTNMLDVTRSRYTINLDSDLDFSNSSSFISLRQFTMWNSLPNIIKTAYIGFTYNTINYNVEFQPGIYSLDAINERLTNYFRSNSLPQLITLGGDEPTSKCYMVNSGPSSVVVDVLVNNPLHILCNFPISTITLQPNITSAFSNVSTFNNVNQIMVHCSVITNAIISKFSDVIYTTTLNRVGVGEQYSVEVNNPTRLKLNNSVYSSIDVYLTNENNQPLIMQENWYATLVIETYKK
jgi:hypothetical protein